MTRPRKIALIAAGSVLGLLLLLVAAAFITARTDWFRNLVRERIVREVENSTGGRVEIGSFNFDWRLLRASVTDFIIHGLEPPEAAPLFRADLVQVELKIVSVWKRAVDIAALEVRRPQVNVIVFADGTNNIPEPKVKRQRDKSVLQTVVDLAVRRFEISDGIVNFASRKAPLNLRGENLRAQLFYDPVATLYRGQVVSDPLYVDRPPGRPLAFRATVPVVIASDRIDVSNGRLETGVSTIGFSGSVENLADPQGSLRLNARLDLGEFDRAFALGLGPRARNAPPLLADITASLAGDRLHIAGARMSMGASNLEASGVLTDLGGPAGSLQLNTRVALGEIGRILALDARPEGTVQLGGNLELRSASDYTLRGKLAARDLSFRRGAQRVSGMSAHTSVEATPKGVELRNLRVSAFEGTFAGSAQVARNGRFQLEGRLDGMDLGQVTRLSGAQQHPWDGRVSGPVHVEGNLQARTGNDVVARARLQIVAGTGPMPVSGQLDVNYDERRGTLDAGRSYLALPHTRLDLSGSIGKQVQVRVSSTDLNDLLPLIGLASPDAPRQLPITLRNGTAVFDGTISGNLKAPHASGRLTLTSFSLDGRTFDRLSADLTASPSGISVQNGTVARGTLLARFEGSLGLTNWKPLPGSPVTASATIQNASLAELAALAGQPAGDFSGLANVSAAVTGTYGDPRATLDLAAEKGTIRGEPFDRMRGRVQYATHTVHVPSFVVESGSAHLDLAATYQYTPGDLWNGRLEFRASTNRVALGRFPVLQRRWPGLAGVLEFAARGSAVVRRAAGGPQVRFTSLDGRLLASGVELNQKPFGDLSLTAATRAGAVSFQLASDFANSEIRGQGEWRLAGDYPIQARLNFSRVWLSSIREWLATGTPGAPTFDLSAEGSLTVTGPVFQPERLTGSLQITQLRAGPVSPGNTRALARVTLRNDGPIQLALDRSVIRIQRARITGPETEFAASGVIALNQKNGMDLRVTGNTQLDLLQDFYRDVFADGAVALNASIRGPVSKPLITGRVDLKDASLNLPDVPNGISNANGTILFDGAQATIDKLTAETGGGKLAIAGFVGYGGAGVVFRMHATATEVRVRYPEGVSTTANADLTLTGTTTRSTLAGTVTIIRAGFNPRSDLGSILAQTAEPVRTPAARGGFLEGMRLDVQIETAPNMQFQTALARDIQAEANLRLRGTAALPAMLGRINITQGELTFFGTRYDIQQGSVAFYNPAKIEPVLNIDLETRARGITVILNVAGPINRLNLTPRSDPPLQFSEIIALLATGRAPTSDPTLLARESTQAQTWQQMGASALLGQAIASPISGRLQRLFGVSRLKIDPSFSGVENNPQARLTLEQQISRDITFTYITNLARSNYQVVRVEWAVNRNWSVVALREENGLFGLDFLYKKRFR